LSSERLANHELAVYCLSTAGGATQHLDTEQVAVLCWRLAPTRFSWRTYPEYPDKDTVRSALSDAKKAKYGHLVDGDSFHGWTLTSEGVAWVRAHQSALQQLEAGPTRSSVSQINDTLLQRLRAHPLLAEWQRGAAAPTRYDIADVTQLTADAPLKLVEQRLGELENTAVFAGDSNMKEFVEWLRSQLPG